MEEVTIIMYFQINNLEISNLQKAIDNDKVITIDIVANNLTEDVEGETVLKEAFDENTVNDFINFGVLEFWHETRNPHLNKHEKNKNLLGKPTAFRWENGLPVVTAQLTKNHPIVQEMLPHLEAGLPVYSASIGGSKVALDMMDSHGQKRRAIPKIKWGHLAIAPANNVVNRDKGMTVKLLQKAQGLMCEFDDMRCFSQNSGVLDNEVELKKALLAPESSSDMYNTAGGSLTKQSLESTPIKLTLSDQDGLDLIDTFINIKSKAIPLEKTAYIKHFEGKKKKDFGYKSYDLIDRYFKNKKGEK